MRLFWTSGRRLFGLLGLFPLLLAACASSPNPGPVYAAPGQSPTPDGFITPTPFQPGAAVNDPPPAASPLPLMPPAPNPASSDPRPLNLVVDINPLTGLPPSDPALLERRPLAIKVSNYPRAIRPQYGLTLADQVFEYYIEWGNTRFIAVFYGNDSTQVGPVRSGRFFDEHVARMYNAFLVFNFADPREWNYLKESDLYPFLVIPGCAECACPPFFVSNAKKLPDERHLTSYFDTTRFSDCIAKKGVNNSRQPIRNGFFSEQVPESGYPLGRVYFYYSEQDYSYWEYDSASRSYLRFQETASSDSADGTGGAYAPLMDAATGRQVDAQNVVILYVSHSFSNKYNAEDEVYHIHLINSGRAYVLRDGIAIPAVWRRPEWDQPLFLTTLDGNPIFLRPGRTFYQVIGVTSTSYQDENGWHFQFQTP